MYLVLFRSSWACGEGGWWGCSIPGEAPSHGYRGGEPGPRRPAFRLLVGSPQTGPFYDRFLTTQSNTLNMLFKKKKEVMVNRIQCLNCNFKN